MWEVSSWSSILPHWPVAVGYFAAAANLVTFSMRTMIPLRTTGIAANCLFIVYGFFAGVYPALILHSILLPLNIVRLYQMLQLVKKVQEASRGELSMDWLKSFMTKRFVRKGEVIFRNGETAKEMFYTVTGRYRLAETRMEVPQGQVIGELGLFAPDNRRTQTFECMEDGELLTISYRSVEQLYFQNPRFGFYFVRLATQRLFSNIARLEIELVETRSK